MGRTETNDRKREEMQGAANRLFGLGWTTKMLAAWMGVSPSTVNTWGRGASMGTNSQRAALARLGSPAEERPRVLDLVANLRREADALAAEIAKDKAAGAFVVAEFRAARIDRIRARARELEALFADGF